MSGPSICPGIAPWDVGSEAVYVVGIKAVIEAKTKDTLTLAGLTLPTRLDVERGIHYLSMTWPEGDETTCSRPHCDGGCDEDSDDDTAPERIVLLEQAIESEHYADHEGPFRFCAAGPCRAANS